MKRATKYSLRLLAAAALVFSAQVMAQATPESVWQAKSFRGADAVAISGISNLGCGE